MSQKQVSRNYSIRFGVAAGIYTVSMPIAITCGQALGDHPARFAVACLPLIGVAVGVWALWRFIRETDEMQSRKLMESLAFSVAGTVLISFAYGMVQLMGAPMLSWVWITPIWAILFGVGSAIVHRRYR